MNTNSNLIIANFLESNQQNGQINSSLTSSKPNLNANGGIISINRYYSTLNLTAPKKPSDFPKPEIITNSFMRPRIVSSSLTRKNLLTVDKPPIQPNRKVTEKSSTTQNSDLKSDTYQSFKASEILNIEKKIYSPRSIRILKSGVIQKISAPVQTGLLATRAGLRPKTSYQGNNLLKQTYLNSTTHTVIEADDRNKARTTSQLYYSRTGEAAGGSTQIGSSQARQAFFECLKQNENESRTKLTNVEFIKSKENNRNPEANSLYSDSTEMRSITNIMGENSSTRSAFDEVDDIKLSSTEQNQSASQTVFKKDTSNTDKNFHVQKENELHLQKGKQALVLCSI